jgi:hypothetical protein
MGKASCLVNLYDLLVGELNKLGPVKKFRKRFPFLSKTAGLFFGNHPESIDQAGNTDRAPNRESQDAEY